MDSPKTAAFFRKALDAMFQSVGFDGFDPEFARQENWYAKRAWSRRQREDFRNWFVSSARKDLKWSERVAEREFGLFDLMWGWRDAREDGDARS
jgi:hypothetical protein